MYISVLVCMFIYIYKLSIYIYHIIIQYTKISIGFTICIFFDCTENTTGLDGGNKNQASVPVTVSPDDTSHRVTES